MPKNNQEYGIPQEMWDELMGSFVDGNLQIDNSAQDPRLTRRLRKLPAGAELDCTLFNQGRGKDRISAKVFVDRIHGNVKRLTIIDKSTIGQANSGLQIAA